MRDPLPSGVWVRIEEIFLAAAELRPAERTRFVDAKCGGDEWLREQVLSLLRYDSPAETHLFDALRTGAASVVGNETAGGRLPGSSLGALLGALLGSWRIESELGRGGMSVVYLARRADGEFDQQVAIKLIKRGMDTDAVIERFRRERRILAALDHPGIARLLDGGATPDGSPWIAMEYVDGVRIDTYCDERGLGIERRCALVAEVCAAVAYAHRNLVIHRDLKPGNILVGRDGKPKLLDFGIAKVLGAGESGESDLGNEALTRGLHGPYTPEYASPEQMNGGAIGTATDVYSLGAVLYELLAGARPNGAAIPASAAALRAGKGKRWARRIEGDLDKILQMALRTEPERRYLSIEQFGRDIGRHLEGLPVTARRETFFYRGGKFLARHRVSAAFAGVLLAVGVTVGMKL